MELADRLAELENDRMKVIAGLAGTGSLGGACADFDTDAAEIGRGRLQAGHLLGGFDRNAGNRVVDATNLVNDAADRILGAADALDARFNLRLGARHQLLDFTCRIAGTLGERPNFLGDNSKTATAF